MTVEDLLTDNVYTFELQEELVRNSENDSWKEIPVKVNAMTETAASDQQVTDDQKQNDAVSDAHDKDATVAAAAAAAESTPTRQSESQLSGKQASPHFLLSTSFQSNMFKYYYSR